MDRGYDADWFREALVDIPLVPLFADATVRRYRTTRHDVCVQKIQLGQGYLKGRAVMGLPPLAVMFFALDFLHNEDPEFAALVLQAVSTLGGA